jgi:hypothetical protein
MWADVQRDLSEILSSRLFPALASDPGYRVILRNAGLTSIPDYKDGKIDPGFAQVRNNWRQQSQSRLQSTSINIRSSTESLRPPSSQD